MNPLESASVSPAFYKGLLDHMSDGVYFVDRKRRILYWNEGAFRLSGYKAEEVEGKYCHNDILCHIDSDGRRLCRVDCPLTACMEDGTPHEASLFLRHKLGRRVPVRVRVQPMRGPDSSIIGAVEIFSDDSDRHEDRRKAEAMERLAFLDDLTHLPNRRFLEMSLQTSASEYQVHKDPFGVLLIDLDKFKEINDSFGHARGDIAMREVAQTLSGALRSNDTVGRWGGDEFLAIVRNTHRANLRMMAERCVFLVAETTIKSGNGKPVPLSVSVGAALFQPGEDFSSFIQRADALLYQSKAKGRSCATIE